MKPRGPRSAVGTAVGRGALAFVTVAGLALAVALISALAFGGATVGGILRLAALELGLFHRVGVELETTPLPNEHLAVVVTGALMLGTVVGLWLMWNAGRAAGGRCEPGTSSRVRAGVGVWAGLTYGAACAAVILVGSAFPLALGRGSVGLEPWPGVFWPSVLGVAAAVAGAFSAGGTSRPYLAGGWRMIAWALVGSFIAMLVVAGLDPSYSRAYFAGVRMARTDHGAAAASHNLLLLPNEATWATTASMGGCIALRGSLEADLLCRGHLPTGLGAPDLVQAPTDPEAALPETFTRFPLVLLVFALVPPIAVAAGGVRAAEDAQSYGAAARAGALAGVVFGVGFTAIAWFSGLSLAATPGSDLLGSLDVALGPVPLSTLAVASAWGIAGGTLGALAGLRVTRWRSSTAPRERS